MAEPARRLACLTLALGLALAAGGARVLLAPRASFADADDPRLVARGAAVYAQHCASCHGARLEGQPHWERAGPDGRLVAPPQDETGHTWMHSDVEIVRAVARGSRDDATAASDMPAFGAVLDADEILAVVAFIKSRWPLGVRAYQALQNPDRRGMPAAAADGDWTLPPNCGEEPTRPPRS
jgi:mono/diheme cytochrome c family protein